MCGGPAHGAIPPLARRQSRAVNLELLLHRIPLGRGFEPSHIAAVAQLSLGIAPNDVVIEDLGHPVALLLLGALLAYSCGYVPRCMSAPAPPQVTQVMHNISTMVTIGLTKHGHMQIVRACLVGQVLGHLVILVIPALAPHQPLDGLCPRQAEVIALWPREVERLVFVEELFLCQDGEDLLLPFEEAMAAQQVVCQSVKVNARAVALGLKCRGAIVQGPEGVGEICHSAIGRLRAIEIW